MGCGYSITWMVVLGHFLGYSDSDTLAMVIAGVASVVGSLCYRLYHARMRFGELLVMVWGFIASRGAIPMVERRLLYDTFSYLLRCGDVRCSVLFMV